MQKGDMHGYKHTNPIKNMEERQTNTHTHKCTHTHTKTKERKKCIDLANVTNIQHNVYNEYN